METCRTVVRHGTMPCVPRHVARHRPGAHLWIGVAYQSRKMSWSFGSLAGGCIRSARTSSQPRRYNTAPAPTSGSSLETRRTERAPVRDCEAWTGARSEAARRSEQGRVMAPIAGSRWSSSRVAWRSMTYTRNGRLARADRKASRQTEPIAKTSRSPNSVCGAPRRA